MNDTVDPVKPVHAGLGLWLGVGAFVVAVAAAGYLYTGKPGAPAALASVGTAAADAAASAPFTEAQVLQLAGKLAERLKAEPDDPTGWTMLGRTYTVLGRANDAQGAFERALKLQPTSAAAHADLADAMATAQGGNIEGEPMRLVERALKLDPDHLKSLAIAGTALFDRGDHAGAARHWERIAKLAPAGSETAQRAQAGVDEARRRGNQAPAASATATNPPAAASPTAAAATTASASAPAPAPAPASQAVRGTVTLADALKARAAPEDTVFIFARAAEGSRMPLAILRRQVKDLPAAFTLDDSQAMAAGAGISSQPRVVVGARISKSGQAMPQPGDLEGLSAAVPVGTSGLKIEISRVLP